MRGMRRLQFILIGSGLAGLGYEILWTRLLSVGLGHEMPSVLAVVSAFFGGLALGSWTLDGRIQRSSRPEIWYAGLEALIGLWGLALLWLIPVLTPWMARSIGIDPSPLWHWVLAFSIPLLLLLPATVAMGGTLPAAERLARLRLGGANAVGGLYAANTLGAVVGITLTVLLVPRWGLTATGVLLALCNCACALGVAAIRPRGKAGGIPQSQCRSTAEALTKRRLALTLFVTGLLGIGFEVMVVRGFSHILEGTVYSFACVLAVFLLGTSLGAAIYQGVIAQQRLPRVLTWLLLGLSTSCLMGIHILWKAPDAYDWLHRALGPGLAASLAAELLIAACVLLMPSLLMGATFAHLGQAAASNGFGLGRALAVNTLGGAVAPALFVVVLLPSIGSVAALTFAALGYLFLLPRQIPGSARFALSGPIALAALSLWGLASVDFVRLKSGERVLVHSEGVMAAVTVIEDRHRARHLLVNGRFQMGGTSTTYSDRREALIPLVLHPRPESALFLGVGTGITFAAAAAQPGLKADGVELVPELASLLTYFEPEGFSWSQTPRLRLSIADARRYVLASHGRYDVIVADLFHPSRDGAGGLYTVEHFRAIQTRLGPSGLFVQWLPLYQLDLQTLKTIIRSFLEVFPNAQAMLAHHSVKAPIIGLIGLQEPRVYPPNWLRSRARDPSLTEGLAKLRVETDFDLFGCFLADSDSLRAFTKGAQLNTDDRPLVSFQAPNFVYQRSEPPASRLLTLIEVLSIRAELVVGTDNLGASLETQRRLSDYVRARDDFIRIGANAEETRDVRRLVERVAEPLLAVVRISPDFSGAYTPLLAMARRLQGLDPQAARELLRDLADANTSRPEAAQLLRLLAPN